MKKFSNPYLLDYRNYTKISGEPFKIVFDDSWLKKDFIIESPDGVQAKILTNPSRKWYKILLQIITIGFYHAPYEYLVEIDKSNYIYDPDRDKI